MIEKLLDETHWTELPEVLKEFAKKRGKSETYFWTTAENYPQWRHIYVIPDILDYMLDDKREERFNNDDGPMNEPVFSLSLKDILEMMTSENQTYPSYQNRSNVKQIEEVKRQLLNILQRYLSYLNGGRALTHAHHEEIQSFSQSRDLHPLYLRVRELVKQSREGWSENKA